MEHLPTMQVPGRCSYREHLRGFAEIDICVCYSCE